jgi:hypothetical protein
VGLGPWEFESPHPHQFAFLVYQAYNCRRLEKQSKKPLVRGFLLGVVFIKHVDQRGLMTALCDLVFLSARRYADWAHVAQFLFLTFENRRYFIKCTNFKGY